MIRDQRGVHIPLARVTVTQQRMKLSHIRMRVCRHIQIGDVRGSGLFIGLELVRDRDAKEPSPEIASQLINRLRHRGILIGAAGRWGNTLKIRPPLCFTRDNADMFIAACDEVLREICPA